MSSPGPGYRILQVVEWVLVVVSATLPTLLKADLEALPPWLMPFRPSLLYVRGITWMLLLTAALLLVGVRFTRQKLSDRWIIDGIRDVLNFLRERAFSADKVDDPLHFHRVTLFRYTRWRWCFQRWPWGGWLVPIARSGHTTQRVKSVFRVPDEADKAEGIAGMTWTMQNTVVIDELPDLNCRATSSQDFAQYADRTKISHETAKSKRPHSRSFMGLPVSVAGQNWGVIVIDSRSPQFTVGKRVLTTYAAVAKPLQRFLERLT